MGTMCYGDGECRRFLGPHLATQPTYFAQNLDTVRPLHTGTTPLAPDRFASCHCQIRVPGSWRQHWIDDFPVLENITCETLNTQPTQPTQPLGHQNWVPPRLTGATFGARLHTPVPLPWCLPHMQGLQVTRKPEHWPTKKWQSLGQGNGLHCFNIKETSSEPRILESRGDCKRRAATHSEFPNKFGFLE